MPAHADRAAAVGEVHARPHLSIQAPRGILQFAFMTEGDLARDQAAMSELGYLRLGQPATELSGGEAQRIKLATELQRSQRGRSLYVLDEPTTGLHASDADLLLVQLQRLVDAGNTVVMIEHDMRAVAQADRVIDVGPGAGDAGGRVVTTGTPRQVARAPDSRTARFLARELARAVPAGPR
ncbi:DUF3422 family protein [Frateuria sp. Soil773]|uniref:DUF3422 family protein n=1 Tax=Frateuria sp. Soil773 TaxID=1736407 RepID=UPI0012FC116A|nr:DUF3422 family protein [Frateuria sp. Soil773]